MEKRCTRCKETKSINEFSKDKSRKDGISASCKQCVNQYRKDNWIKIKELMSTWNKKNRNKSIEYEHKYKHSPKGKIIHRKHMENYSGKYPEKRKANHIVNNSIQSGKLPPVNSLTCSRCGIKQAEHYHHPDYTKPLEIIPVCIDCHTEIHREL